MKVILDKKFEIDVPYQVVANEIYKIDKSISGPRENESKNLINLMNDLKKRIWRFCFF